MFSLNRLIGRQEYFCLETERLLLRVLYPSEANRVTEYLVRNREFHRPFHQVHEDDYFTFYEQSDYMRGDLSGFRRDECYPFWISYKSDPSYVIGRVAYTAVIRGALSSCLLGYHLDQNEVGKGIMKEAISSANAFVFMQKKIHRIQADIMPENARSIATIESLGFNRQGLNEKYMCIDGVWRDHFIYAKINESI